MPEEDGVVEGRVAGQEERAGTLEVRTQPAPVPAPRYSSELALSDAMTMAQLLERRELVVQAMQQAMKEDLHYGKVPGVDKPGLFKPGAELLGVLFKYSPRFPEHRLIQRWHENGHLDVTATCELYHYPTGLLIAEGIGMCSSQEEKYAFRNAKRKCPECGKETIYRSKYPPKGAPEGTQGGWWCSKREGGCGTEYYYEDEKIRDQEVGKVPNPNLADQYNTVVKMACKRALVDAMLHATGASDMFTQDVEDTAATTDGPFEGATGAEQATGEAAAATQGAAAPRPGGAPAEQAPWLPVPGYQPQWQSLREVVGGLNTLSSAYPWNQLMGAATQLALGLQAATFGDLEPAQKREVWLRMNRVYDHLAEHGSQPFITPDEVSAAFAFGFEGVLIPVQAPQAAQPAEPAAEAPAPAAAPPVSTAPSPAVEQAAPPPSTPVEGAGEPVGELDAAAAALPTKADYELAKQVVNDPSMSEDSQAMARRLMATYEQQVVGAG